MSAVPQRLYQALVTSVAVVLLGLGVLLAIQMISAVVGPFRLADLGGTDPRAVVGIWRGARESAGVSIRAPFGHDLVEAGRSLRELVSLRGLDPAQVGSVLLRDPRDMDDAEQAALEHFVGAGGGAVVLGSIGVLAADGSWRGYAAMQKLLGVAVEPLADRDDWMLAPAVRGPLAAALAPGQRVPIRDAAGLPAARLRDAELRWQAPGAAPLAAALRRELGAGRLVWIAARPEQALSRDPGQQELQRVVEAALAWVSRTPWVEVLPWPKGAAFTAVVQRSVDEARRSQLERDADWERELAGAEASAGLAQLGVPPVESDGVAEALATTLGRLGRRGVWVATRTEVAGWARSRASIDAAVRRAGPRRLVIEVTNRSRMPVADVVLRVHLNEPAEGIHVERTQVFQQAAPVRVRPRTDAVDLMLPEIGGRDSIAYSLDYEPVQSRDG